MIDAGYEIERLLRFGEKHGLIDGLDVILARNHLLDLFLLSEPYTGEVPGEEPAFAAEILDRLVEYAARQGITGAEYSGAKELFDTRIMGMLMPRAAEVAGQFYKLAASRSLKAATDYFYNLSIASNYIRMADINKNISWNVQTEFGEIEITINLSKPEKDPKAIAREKLLLQSAYPKCLLCMENIGYAGRLNFPARQTLRFIPVTVSGQQWYLQYSPYVYYNEHCIVFSEKHEPMRISKDTFGQLLDFVRQFPHYLCGSNADLPIVGGSILSHNHFQGGNYIFPMHRAKPSVKFSHPHYDGIAVSLLKWPLSTIRAAGADLEELVDFCAHFLEKWREYDDESADIKAYTENAMGKVPHNTITPIGRINPAGEFEMDLVLRNNRASEEFPDGIFHPHREIHHIKKENIGLIEVMGLAILPGRLQRELEGIKEILTGKKNTIEIKDGSHELYKHLDWIKEMAGNAGCALSEESANQLIREQIGEKFKTGLEHSGVFKQDEKGLKAFNRFMRQAGCVPLAEVEQ